jgi:hypothetical protein
MKNFVFIFIVLSLVSCEYFQKQIPTKEEVLAREMKAINWNEVDEFPSVSNCDSIESKSERERCFFEFLAQTIQQKLSIDTLSILYPELDTIEVKVTIFPDASMQFDPKFPKDSVAYDTIKIDSILRYRLLDFPKVNPATKRGLPVKTQFILPVIIKSE